MKNILLCSILFIAILVPTRFAFAALGDTADSITTDRQAISAAKGATTVNNNFTVQEIVSDSATIREYISVAGIVFAVAWNGLTNPDLTQLLGSYATEYHDTVQKTPREPGRRSSRIESNRLVVEKWGHMPNLQGRAYDPSLIPSGVTIDDIK